MQRRQFTRTCIACIASAGIMPFIDACSPTRYITGTLETNGITVDKAEFKYRAKGQEHTMEYVLVQHEALDFPIYLYRHSDNDYAALLMQCTHQGNELSASGDHLTCPAHGSEFDKNGSIVQGPAEFSLRKFPVTAQGDKIFIDLRAQS